MLIEFVKISCYILYSYAEIVVQRKTKNNVDTDVLSELPSA